MQCREMPARSLRMTVKWPNYLPSIQTMDTHCVFKCHWRPPHNEIDSKHTLETNRWEKCSFQTMGRDVLVDHGTISQVSSLVFLKNKFRNKLCVESDLRLKLTSFNPEIDFLVSAKQCHKLHWLSSLSLTLLFVTVYIWFFL